MTDSKLLELDGVGNVLLQRFKPSLGGLGLGGAISINLIFGLVLAGWLALSSVSLPSRGTWFFSLLAMVLVGISAAEALALWRRQRA